MSSLRLSKQQADSIRALIERNEVHAALSALMSAASHQGDRDLRNFAANKLAEFAGITNAVTEGTLERVEQRTEIAKIRLALLDKLDAHEEVVPVLEPETAAPQQDADEGKGVPVSTAALKSQPLLRCTGLSKHYGSLDYAASAAMGSFLSMMQRSSATGSA